MTRRRTFEATGWLVGPVALLALCAASWLALRRPVLLAWGLAGLVILVPAGWVLVSALWPGRAERGCPACRKEALVRLDARTTVGLRCTACGWRDESASGWLLAEEEGPLEELVLSQRGRRTPPADVDSPPRAG